jgi:hypothetical protein
MSREDTKTRAFREQDELLRAQYEKMYPKRIGQPAGSRPSFEDFKREQWKAQDKTSKSYTEGKSSAYKLIGGKLEDMLYGGWYGNTNIRDPITGAITNRNTFDLTKGGDKEQDARGKFTAENAKYTRTLLKQLYPTASEAQLDNAAAKAMQARGGKQWREVDTPSQIAAAIGKYMPGGVNPQQKKILDSLAPQWAERREMIKDTRNSEDDVRLAGTQKLAATVLGAMTGGFSPLLAGGIAGFVGSGGDPKSAAKGAGMGYLGGQLAGGVGDMFSGSGSGGLLSSGTSGGGGFSSYLDDLFGGGYVDGGSVVDLGGSMDDYLNSFGGPSSSGGSSLFDNIGDYVDGSSVVDLGGSIDDYLGGGTTGGNNTPTTPPTTGGGSSIFDKLYDGGKTLMGSLFGGGGTGGGTGGLGSLLSGLFGGGGNGGGLLSDLLSLYGGYQGDKNTDNSLKFLQGALDKYGDPFKDQRRFSTDLWKQSYKNPEHLYKEYMSGQGQQFLDDAAAKYAAAGRRNMLPQLESQAHRKFYTDYLPQYRQGVDPSKFGGTNANSILGGITNLQGMNNAGILGGLSNIFG